MPKTITGTVVNADGTEPDERPIDRHRRMLDAEIEARRVQVLQLRLRQMSIPQIAVALGMSEATISLDLKFIHNQWKDRYGMNPTTDPAVIVGEAMALFQESERLALREYNNLQSERGPVAARTRLMALRAANEAKDRQVNLLQDLGILERALGTIELKLPQAAQIRQLMKDVTVTDDMLLPPAERESEPAA